MPDAPKITCPSAVTLPSSDGKPLAVSYGTPTTTAGSPPVTIACTPASGATFPIGATTVTCTATDALQRTNACTFTVTVQAPPKLSVTRFLAFGDSMTAGEVTNPGTLSGLVVRDDLSYPTDLRTALRVRYPAQSTTVVNAGQSGETAVQGDLRIADYLRNGQYDVVLLMEGANDIQSRNFMDIDAAIAALRDMVRTATVRGVRPFVATLPPEATTRLSWPLVQPFNDQLRQMAASENVTLVDVYTAFGGDLSLIGADGLHPTTAGYQRIADTFFATIKQTFEVSSASLSFQSRFLRPW